MDHSSPLGAICSAKTLLACRQCYYKHLSNCQLILGGRCCYGVDIVILPFCNTKPSLMDPSLPLGAICSANTLLACRQCYYKHLSKRQLILGGRCCYGDDIVILLRHTVIEFCNAKPSLMDPSLPLGAICSAKTVQDRHQWYSKHLSQHQLIPLHASLEAPTDSGRPVLLSD